ADRQLYLTARLCLRLPVDPARDHSDPDARLAALLEVVPSLSAASAAGRELLQRRAANTGAGGVPAVRRAVGVGGDGSRCRDGRAGQACQNALLFLRPAVWHSTQSKGRRDYRF